MGVPEALKPSSPNSPGLPFSPQPNMLPPNTFQPPPPMHMKGELVGLEYDGDHRKRRRNRTTQSCLNCHTSKRKCDRKRPCQRCIQLGLTGLCVYEIDDPALRDDPTVDESTRLKKRIAELESLVRELRGKPHPRWADAGFRDGDPADKWHSRASKSSQQTAKRRASPDHAQVNHIHRNVPGLTPVKTEPISEGPQNHLYRFSPAPESPIRYNNNYPLEASSPHPTFVNGHSTGHRHTYSAGSSGGSSVLSYHCSSSAPAISYANEHHQQQPGHHSHPSSSGSSFSDSGIRGGAGTYQVLDYDDEPSCYEGNGKYSPGASPIDSYCSCRSDPSMGHTLNVLSDHLRETVGQLRHCREHAITGRCRIYREILQLQRLLDHESESCVENPGSAYDPLPTPTDSDVLTPNTPYQGSMAGGGPSPHEWNQIAPAGYNPYFPMQPGEHGFN